MLKSFCNFESYLLHEDQVITKISYNFMVWQLSRIFRALIGFAVAIWEVPNLTSTFEMVKRQIFSSGWYLKSSIPTTTTRELLDYLKLLSSQWKFESFITFHRWVRSPGEVMPNEIYHVKNDRHGKNSEKWKFPRWINSRRGYWFFK